MPTGKRLDGSFYLVVSRKGSNWLAARITLKSPKLAAGEIVLRLTLVLPEALFLKPSIEAKITVPDSGVTPFVITPDMQDNIAETLTERLGVNVSITVPTPPET